MIPHRRLLAEDLLLLAWDDAAGRPRGGRSLQLPVAIGGSLLLDLALRDRLRIEVDVPRASTRPTGDDLLDEVAAELRAGPSRRRLRRWVRRVGTTTRRDRVRERLIAEGLLVAEEQRVLRLATVTRHRLTADAPLEQMADTVRRVLAGGRAEDDRTAALAALVGSTPVIDQLLPRSERRAARQRAVELADSASLSAPVRAVINDTRAAVSAAGANTGAGTASS